MDENGRRRQGTLAVGLAIATAAVLGKGHKNNVISQSLGLSGTISFVRQSSRLVP